MKKFVAAAALAATFMTGSALPSMAAATVPVVSTLNGSFSGTSPTAQSPMYDYFAFAIPFQSSYTVNALVGATNSAVKITAFDFISGDLTQVLESGTIGTFAGKSVASLADITLAKGLYYIGVRSTGGNNSANFGYSGTLSVSQVPLPSTVALFGVALAGLGVAGVARKRSNSANAAA